MGGILGFKAAPPFRKIFHSTLGFGQLLPTPAGTNWGKTEGWRYSG